MPDPPRYNVSAPLPANKEKRKDGGKNKDEESKKDGGKKKSEEDKKGGGEQKAEGGKARKKAEGTWVEIWELDGSRVWEHTGTKTKTSRDPFR